MSVDVNRLIRQYLTTSSTTNDPLIALIGGAGSERMYCPILPENVTLPAISYFIRGGTSSHQIPTGKFPSLQFDCWADSQEGAREVYLALYDALQGLGNAPVVLDGDTYYIIQSREEVQGQDIIDETQGYYRVLTFFSITIRSDI